MLSKQGYTVIEARNGEDALRLSDSRGAEVDLLVSETLMSKVTGPDLAARLLAFQPLNACAVYVARESLADRATSRSTRTGFLPRPFTNAHAGE
jgi:two-component system, cell cycle sensor histidine kinase and response regulator CckA